MSYSSCRFNRSGSSRIPMTNIPAFNSGQTSSIREYVKYFLNASPVFSSNFAANCWYITKSDLLSHSGSMILCLHCTCLPVVVTLPSFSNDVHAGSSIIPSDRVGRAAAGEERGLTMTRRSSLSSASFCFFIIVTEFNASPHTRQTFMLCGWSIWDSGIMTPSYHRATVKPFLCMNSSDSNRLCISSYEMPHTSHQCFQPFSLSP